MPGWAINLHELLQERERNVEPPGELLQGFPIEQSLEQQGAPSLTEHQLIAAVVVRKKLSRLFRLSRICFGRKGAAGWPQHTRYRPNITLMPSLSVVVDTRVLHPSCVSEWPRTYRRDPLKPTRPPAYNSYTVVKMPPRSRAKAFSITFASD